MLHSCEKCGNEFGLWEAETVGDKVSYNGECTKCGQDHMIDVDKNGKITNIRSFEKNVIIVEEIDESLQ